MSQATLTLGPEGRRYQIYDPGGGGRVAKILRTGTPYESQVVADMAAAGAVGRAVDVGANIGNHTLWLAVVCQLQVVAFEPIKYEKLRANVVLNGLQDRVTIHQVALGNQVGRATALERNRLDVGTGDIPIVTLDEFALDDVSILKIDVESMEPDVIRGGLDTIGRNRPIVYAEAWDDAARDVVDGLLKPLGYTFARSFKWNQNKWVP